MNVEIGAEAALFPEKEYIKGIFLAVHYMYVQKSGFKIGTKTPKFVWSVMLKYNVLYRK
jgi:hypothetical protein